MTPLCHPPLSLRVPCVPPAPPDLRLVLALAHEAGEGMELVGLVKPRREGSPLAGGLGVVAEPSVLIHEGNWFLETKAGHHQGERGREVAPSVGRGLTGPGWAPGDRDRGIVCTPGN